MAETWFRKGARNARVMTLNVDVLELDQTRGYNRSQLQYGFEITLLGVFDAVPCNRTMSSLSYHTYSDCWNVL